MNLLFNTLFLGWLIVAMSVSSCGLDRPSDFESQCKSVARIEIIDPSGWEEYLNALRSYYRLTDQSDRYMKLWPLDGYPVRSDLSLSRQPSKLPPSPFRNDFNVYVGERLIARAISLTTSVRSIDSNVDSHCIYNFPEFYDIQNTAKDL